MIDRFRAQIQQRLDELTSEAERLRKALAALDPRSSASRRAATRGSSGSARTHARASAETNQSSPAKTTLRRRTRQAASSPRRSAPGATRASVLAALKGGKAMTASEVAAKAGLERATVSTTLSKLAKSGEVQKADRGYRLARR